MTQRMHRLAVAICGVGHSGSTLLGLVLGSHSRAFYAGEAKKSLFIGDPAKKLRKRVCKLCGETCPVWSRFVPPGEPDLYEALARLTNREVVVDSTKDVAWIRERRDELCALGIPQKLVVLARDGRAVVNSRLRKRGAGDAAAIIDGWIAQVRATAELAREAGRDALALRYEELATDPEGSIRRVCDHLGLTFEADMLRYESKPHHPLGGNTGTQSLVARATGAPSFTEVPERSRAYYSSMRGGFRLDLRWRQELPRDVLALFEERANAINAPFRWEVGE